MNTFNFPEAAVTKRCLFQNVALFTILLVDVVCLCIVSRFGAGVVDTLSRKKLWQDWFHSDINWCIRYVHSMRPLETQCAIQYMYMFIHIYIYICMYIYVYIYVYIYIYICICICVCVRVYINEYLRTTHGNTLQPITTRINKLQHKSIGGTLLISKWLMSIKTDVRGPYPRCLSVPFQPMNFQYSP